MRLFIGLLILSSVYYGADLNIRVYPDSIYVGTLANITIAITDLHDGEFPVFPEIIEISNQFSVVERILNNHSTEYVLQFWEPGLNSIPSLRVVVKKNNVEMYQLQSDTIEISVLSNINENNAVLKSIKPMLEFNIISPFRTLLYSLLLVIGMCMLIYILKKRRMTDEKRNNTEVYRKSIFEETIRNMRSLKHPQDSNRQNTEIYYLKLSHICRTYIKERFFVRATEMTSQELGKYFQTIGINNELLENWLEVNQIADLAKYAGQMPTMVRIKKDKEDFMHIIKSLNKIVPQISE